MSLQPYLFGSAGFAGKPSSVEPSSPAACQAYLDDGTNTANGLVGWRVYDGTEWVDAVGGAGAPPGTMMDFAGATPPAGWLECDGSAVDRTTYAALFATIGTVWGAGDGSVTFNLPDLRRRTTIGRGGTQVSGPGTSVGDVGGAEVHTLSQDEMPSHNHSYTRYDIREDCDNGNDRTGGRFATTRSTGNRGGSQPHNNMQPSATMLKIVRA